MDTNINTDISTLLESIGTYIDANKDELIKEANKRIAARLSNGVGTYFSPSFSNVPQDTISNDDIITIVSDIVDEYCKNAIDDLRVIRTMYVNKVEDSLTKSLGRRNFIDNLKTYDESAYFIEDKVYAIVDEIKTHLAQ